VKPGHGGKVGLQGVAVSLLQSGCQSSECFIAELFYGVGVHRFVPRGFLSGAIAPLVCGLLIRALEGHVGRFCFGRNRFFLALGSVELQNGVSADFPNPMAGALALVIAASELALI
jgi:hypothetical protein